MPALTIPNTFSPNTVAVSAEVNANFNAIATLLNSTKLDDDNIQTGGIVSDNLAAASVTKVKLNSDVADNSTIELDVSNGLQLKDSGTTLAKLAAAVAQALCPVGSVLAYTAASAPSGYLVCDGTAYSRTTYAPLFAVIGITHGQGDGVTTFNVPDYRGRFLRMVDGSAGRDPDKASRTIMNTGGSSANNIGSVQTSAFASHNHTIAPTGGNAAFSISNSLSGSNDGSGAAVVTASTGASTETRPINAYVNYIIKT